VKNKKIIYLIPFILILLFNNLITKYINPLLLVGVLIAYMGFLVFTKKLELKSPTVILFIGFVLVSVFIYVYYKI
jgi:hypothetical protein